MSHLLALTARNVSAKKSMQPGLVRLGNSTGDHATRWPGGLHSHPYPEICIPLTKNVVLDFEDRRFRLAPPALGVFEPHTIHCEAYAKRNISYLLLWMSFSGSSVLAMVSRYRWRHGWDMPHRWAIQHSSGKRVFKLLSEGDPRLEKLDLLRADLLCILADLLKRSHYAASINHPASRGVRHEQLLEGIKAFIDNHLAGSMSVTLLAASAGLTPNYLNFLFQQWSGESIHGYIIRRRMELAMELCEEGKWLIKQIARRVGYNDPLYFSRAFRRFHGISPGETRDRSQH